MQCNLNATQYADFLVYKLIYYFKNMVLSYPIQNYYQILYYIESI